MERDNPWNDDQSWWHQLDLEMQEREEQERINNFNAAVAALRENDYAE